MTNKFPTAQAWLTHAVNEETVDIQDLLLLVVSKVDADDIQDAFQSLMDEDGYFDDEDNDSDLAHNKEEDAESMIIEISGHEIEYWYNDGWQNEITEDSANFDHIQASVIIGYVEGQLATWDDDISDEHLGWWKKVK